MQAALWGRLLSTGLYRLLKSTVLAETHLSLNPGSRAGYFTSLNLGFPLWKVGTVTVPVS